MIGHNKMRPVADNQAFGIYSAFIKSIDFLDQLAGLTTTPLPIMQVTPG
jgi:hypothetical protein